MSRVPSAKFNTKDRPEFFRVLRGRVNMYFEEKNISRNGNWSMKFKTVFMVGLYLIPLVLMLTGVVSNSWTALAMWVLMGFGMSGIGLSVMHDANHGSYSDSPAVNRFMSYILTLVGGFHTNWQIQHNVLHHSYTNVHGLDEDIDKGVMRFCPTQERKEIFKYQAFYAPFLYALMTIYWLTVKDFQQLSRYHKNNLLEAQGLTYGKALASIILVKVLYVSLFIALPIVFIALPWWQIVLGFLTMQFISGLILALIFQPAHVVGETHFFQAEPTGGSLENNWAIHQMQTTSNFAHKSRFFSWFVGGLNYQIEHHLFPNICHVHYRSISQIVKETAAEFNIPYYQHETFLDALKSHFKFLHHLGTGKYDSDLAARLATEKSQANTAKYAEVA